MTVIRNTVATGEAWRLLPDLHPTDAIANRTAAPAKSLDFGRSARSLHRAAQVRRADVNCAALSFENMGHFGDLLPRYLAARRAVFIDRLKWNLPQVDGMEFDQYDTPMCRWIVLHEFGEVLGGIRLVPTTARCGIYSYMLRDGQKGLLEDFPKDVLFFEAPVSDTIWEASRLFIADAVPAGRRADLQQTLMRQMILAAFNQQARHVIGIVPAIWSRWLRRLGLYAAPVGPRFTAGGVASQAALFNIADQLQWAREEERLAAE